MTQYNLENKVAVITGAAQGIGFAIAEQFLKKGAKTAVLLDINEDGTKIADKLNKRYGPNKAVYIKCDITKDLDSVSKHIFDMVKKVDILVNNAGIGGFDIRKLIETNLTALMEWSLKFLEHMREKNNGGTIINISSLVVFCHGKMIPFYKTSKYGVYAFSRTLGHSKNYNRHGVRVIVVCPGLTETSIENGVIPTMDKQDDRKEWMKTMSRHIPQNPEMVGHAVAEIYEKADSGTAWVIAENRPIEKVPELQNYT